MRDGIGNFGIRCRRGDHKEVGERGHDYVSSEYAAQETRVLVGARTRINCGQYARPRSFCMQQVH